MNGNESAQTIERRAAEWVARSDRGLDGDAATELQDWLAGDRRRRGALLKAEAAWMLLDRGRVLSGSSAIARRSFVVDGLKSRVFQWAAGLAATAALVALAVTLSSLSSSEAYRTNIGEVRRIALSDGSLAEINTASRLAVSMVQTRRVVALEEGEAWFQVASDATRPFIVEAGKVRVQALGTAFCVRRRPSGAEVVVTEGAVQTWTVGSEESTLRLDAGSRAIVDTRHSPVALPQATAQIERSLAWRSGQIALQGETLREAAAEFNRYNTRKLIVEDEAMAREQLVGWFRTHEPEGFARAVASSLHARVRIDGERIRIEPVPLQ